MARHRKTSDASSAAAPFPPPDTAAGRGRSAREADGFPVEPRTARVQGKSSSRDAVSARTLAPGLYVVATPIGNSADVTLRALSVLRQSDAIVAEDTRVTSRLLAIHGISRPLLTYNDHNGPSARPKLLARLAGGARLALVSDAGTPLVSDPGHKLVKEAREQGIAIYPIPGASAALAALVASGLPSDRFLFAGFPPAKSGERKAALEGLAAIPATLIFYESPQRLGDSLSDMAAVLGAREAVVARELTKLHEEMRSGTLASLAETYAGAPPKGEITIVVGPPSADERPVEAAKVVALLRQALPFMPVRAAAGLISEATGASRRSVYEQALALKAQDDGEA